MQKQPLFQIIVFYRQNFSHFSTYFSVFYRHSYKDFGGFPELYKHFLKNFEQIWHPSPKFMVVFIRFFMIDFLQSVCYYENRIL